MHVTARKHSIGVAFGLPDSTKRGKDGKRGDTMGLVMIGVGLTIGTGSTIGRWTGGRGTGVRVGVGVGVGVGSWPGLHALVLHDTVLESGGQLEP